MIVESFVRRVSSNRSLAALVLADAVRMTYHQGSDRPGWMHKAVVRDGSYCLPAVLRTSARLLPIYAHPSRTNCLSSFCDFSPTRGLRDRVSQLSVTSRSAVGPLESCRTLVLKSAPVSPAREQTVRKSTQPPILSTRQTHSPPCHSTKRHPRKEPCLPHCFRRPPRCATLSRPRRR